MRLVNDWRKAWKWLSVQSLAVLAVAPVVWSQLPPDVRNMLPEGWEPYVLAALAVGGIVGRLKAQDHA